jgi:hypothetical protein
MFIFTVSYTLILLLTLGFLLLLSSISARDIRLLLSLFQRGFKLLTGVCRYYLLYVTDVILYLTMATNEKPLFVFIPGAWHGPEGFDAVRQGLSQQGYSSEAIALPSIGAEPPNKGLHSDIVHVYGILKQLADQGKQIILVMHSYGGMVGSGAVKGVEYAQRGKDGEKGGVIMLVFMCAFLTPKGSSLRDMLGGQWLPWFVIKVSRSSLSFVLLLFA